MGYRFYLEEARRKGVFIEHLAGDVDCFRYPHADAYERVFHYDDRLKCWRGDAGLVEKPSDFLDALRGFASEDITVYEFLSPAARRIHCLDMIGVSYGDDLRELAFSEVSSLYERRHEIFSDAEISTVCASGLSVRGEFSYLRELYGDVEDVPIRIMRFDVDGTWPFGSVLKGTDVVLTDGDMLNFGQDVLHALYHLHEGIPGVNGDNCHVRELWAPVPALYALQLAEGRLSRRIRLRPSPHPIHFTDYIFLRAYLGQGFFTAELDAGGADVADVMHPAYALIEPAVRLMASALDEKDAWDRNRILADAVLADEVGELIGCFDRRYGPGSFEAVFDTYSLYDKRRRALEFMAEDELDAIMFGGPMMIPSGVPRETVELIWKDEALRADPKVVLDMIGFA